MAFPVAAIPNEIAGESRLDLGSLTEAKMDRESGEVDCAHVFLPSSILVQRFCISAGVMISLGVASAQR